MTTSVAKALLLPLVLPSFSIAIGNALQEELKNAGAGVTPRFSDEDAGVQEVVRSIMTHGNDKSR